MVLVVLLSAAVGGVALGGTAAALDPGAGATYPLTPSSDTLGTFVYVVRPGDSVAENGIKEITLDAGPNADVSNVTDDDVFIAVRGGQRIEIAENNTDIVDVANISVSPNQAGDEVTITLPRPVQPQFASDSPNTGAEVAVKVGNFTTPDRPGSHSVNATFATASGSSDGPTSVSYSTTAPELSMNSQNLSQFSDQQSINVSASVPGGGYVGLFTTASNGSPGELIGSTDVATATSSQQYSIDVSGNVTESQQLMAVAYSETNGRSASLRENQTFDPSDDERLRTNGTLVNATANVSTLDVDGRVEAGGEYAQGARLYFPQGEPDTNYQVRSVEDGELGSAATQFQTGANDTTILDTSDLSEGQYAITRIADDSLVSLDNDSTTSAQDDSILITGQQATTQANTTNASDGAATDTGATATASSGEGDTATDGNASGNGSANASDNGSGTDTSSSGPGFGIAVAVVALLGAALLVTRRNR
ncbi:PGF-CTERM sorting domain-containing protein [Halococcus dombrowskii]|uniref:PGF-CTERM sorting domain-containing protein n=1 Tax=Halococcus dombrowskii TaxID=179637 RepID=A0AAV3SCK5_HALDO|nr:PGF-CTERM sorting domain-containing protein [Halococcus dombrowskii]UOO96539.1 PGF-CTERM sorting domain-containing protein [Halococcus dombrowskii]